jgi:hypothetical protein
MSGTGLAGKLFLLCAMFLLIIIVFPYTLKSDFESLSSIKFQLKSIIAEHAIFMSE